MMEKLKERAEALIDVAVQQKKADVKAALIEELPDKLSVEGTGEGVIVSGANLGTEMIGHSSLRDVAFLMRGVR